MSHLNYRRKNKIAPRKRKKPTGPVGSPYLRGHHLQLPDNQRNKRKKMLAKRKSKRTTVRKERRTTRPAHRFNDA